MYRKDLDALKGIAIIAVVLFHIGLLKSGYLGVDTFFVINGLLVIPSVIKKIEKGEFAFIRFMEKRVIRLLPLIVLASAVSLGLGYWLMLPDDYENLSQGVIAGNLMSENILSAVTTKDYWDTSNDYKPLMHLWYVGILFEFYIVMSLLMMGANKVAKLLKKNEKKWMIGSLAIVSVISLFMYLKPDVEDGDRFYYLPYRFFELGIGGLIGLYISVLNKGGVSIQRIANTLLIAVIFCSVYNLLIGDYDNWGTVIGRIKPKSSGMPFSGNVALLLTVALTGVVVACKDGGSRILRSRVLAWLGKMSYSIFIWHQVLLAFYRYSVSNDVTIGFTLNFLIVTMIVSCLSYFFVEKKISGSHKSFIGWSIAAILVMIPSGWLYLNAGVVRDIPELDIKKEEVRRDMFGEYCDRIYQYKELPDANGKSNVIVEGISFGRDFANILLESKFRDSINLVYVYRWQEAKNIAELVSRADFIFTFSRKQKVPSEVWDNLQPHAIIKGIGTKNYGECNGIIYRNRHKSNYLQQTIEMEQGYWETNEQLKKEWGAESYIDLIEPVLVEENRVRVFSDDGYYLSPDNRHLCKAGAQYYAKILDWEKIFEKKLE